MRKVWEKMVKTMIKNMVVIALICCVTVLLIKENQIHYIQGIAAGTMVSALKLILLKKRIAKEMGMREDKVFAYSMLGYSARYILTGLLLAVSAVYSFQMFLGTVVGLLTLRVALLIQAFSKSK